MERCGLAHPAIKSNDLLLFEPFSESAWKAWHSFKKTICWQATFNRWKGRIWVGSFMLFCFLFFFPIESIRLIFMPNWSSSLWRWTGQYMHGWVPWVFSSLDDLFGRICHTVRPSKGSLKCPQWLLTTVNWIKGQLLETTVSIIFSPRQVNMRWLLLYLFCEKMQNPSLSLPTNAFKQ